MHMEHDAPPRAFKVSNGDAPVDRPPVVYTREGPATPRRAGTPRDARWVGATSRRNARGGVGAAGNTTSAGANAGMAAVRV